MEWFVSRCFSNLLSCICVFSMPIILVFGHGASFVTVLIVCCRKCPIKVFWAPCYEPVPSFTPNKMHKFWAILRKVQERDSLSYFWERTISDFYLGFLYDPSTIPMQEASIFSYGTIWCNCSRWDWRHSCLFWAHSGLRLFYGVG